MRNHIAVIALAVALASSTCFAGGEVPVRVYRETPIVVEKPSFLKRTFTFVATYTQNRLHDVGDVASGTIDAVAGVFTLDPQKDDEK